MFKIWFSKKRYHDCTWLSVVLGIVKTRIVEYIIVENYNILALQKTSIYFVFLFTRVLSEFSKNQLELLKDSPHFLKKYNIYSLWYLISLSMIKKKTQANYSMPFHLIFIKFWKFLKVGRPLCNWLTKNRAHFN